MMGILIAKIQRAGTEGETCQDEAIWLCKALKMLSVHIT